VKQFPDSWLCFTLGILLTILAGCRTSAPGEVEIIRDQWGIAHVYADSEPAAFFGAGFATAEDRLFQIMLKRRQAQGRLAEIMGSGPDGRFLESDRLHRTLGVQQAAIRELGLVPARERELLEAYARGISEYLKQNAERLSPLFHKYGGVPELWKAEDCLAIWIAFGIPFSPAWKSEVLAKRAFEKDPAALMTSRPLDDEAAIVSEEEFQRSNSEVYRKLKEIAQQQGPKEASLFYPAASPPKASHSWVVAGRRSTTGKPLLGGKPQLTVENPNAVYEIHIMGGEYNVRGIIVPGCPAFLEGFTDAIAWAPSALNSDSADLFEERVDPARPGQYLWKDSWREFQTRTEVIRIKGQESEILEVRETIHGPVVNHLIDGERDDEVYTLKSTALSAESSSVAAFLQIMRARNWESFRRAAARYHAPAIHVAYADRDGNIGYQSMVSIPARRSRRVLPRQGWTGDDEWEMLPFEYLPSMLNPKSGVVSTANDLPVGSWHPFVTCDGYGGGPRSWRLKELLAGDRKFSARDFLTDIHRDVVNPPARDFVRLVLAVIDAEKPSDQTIKQAAELYRKWDGRLLTDSQGFALINSLVDRFQEMAKGDWILSYGGGWSGLTSFLRKAVREYETTGQPPTDLKMREWLLQTTREAYAAMERDEGKDSWTTEGLLLRMPYQANGEFFGSLAPEYDQISPPLKAFHVHTIWSQRGEMYVQIVDFSDLDSSLAMLPPGNSERPDSPHFNDQTELWKGGNLRAAPISREAVKRLSRSVTRLTYRNDHER